jgi:valyl-tRNA synthetase
MKLPKTYDPSLYESDIYALWEKSGAFKPKARGHNESYSIVMPPPNANANLHIGFALTGSLEDIAVRYNRMLGKATLFVPGADHAGFETQSVYEKRLAKDGKSRFDFSREELYTQIYDFVAQNRVSFERQMRAMGMSADWEHFTYTLDQKVIDRAYATFKKLWDDKLVYRGERLVNYCTFHGTGFADIEVEYKDASSPLYYLKYGPFELATTRPETKFGDTAVAVHPDDERYKEWVNKVITVEGLNGPFEIRVVADEMVDPNFGTGAVKITPAHDFNDYEVAQRHNLPAIRVINHDGTLNERAGQFKGMPVLEARKAVVEALKEKDLLVRIDEDYQNRVGTCYKCGTVIEPMLMEQWFIDMKPLAKTAIEALKNDKIAFHPSAKKDQLIGYLEGLRDWNISRQIAWGIPIPAFQNVDDHDDWVFDTRVDQEIIEVDGKTYRRDPDVFDTWFSSSSWPYATLDFPDSDDFKKYYPLDLMETGGEILYPWVSRMIMLGLYVSGEVPFEAVYIHGYVMAEDGSKMSKSKGNTIDPLPVIEQYGSDALRMGIVAGRSPAVNRGYDSRRVEEARNFANKLWNIARYIEGTLGSKLKPDSKPDPKSIADHWVLDRLNSATKTLGEHLDNYRFSEAYELLYHLVWDDVADWYIEASKFTVNPSVLNYTLETILKLTHPFAPFVTETIWQTLHPESDSLLITSKWPKSVHVDTKKAADFADIQTIVSEVRHIKTLLKIKKGTLYYQDGKAPFVAEHAKNIADLAKLEGVKEVTDGKGLHLTQHREPAWLDVDFETAREFTKSLAGRKTAIEQQTKQIESRLSNEGYLQKAPKQLVEESRSQLESLQAELGTIESQISQFSNF